MNQKKRLSVKTVVLIGMFGALASVLERNLDPSALCTAGL